MSYITYEMMQDLLKVNFRFPAYEHFLNLGMIYYYQGSEYFIGGESSEDFSEKDKIVARDGCWLPEDTQLLEWLKLVGMEYQIEFNSANNMLQIRVKDNVSDASYEAKGGTLAGVLWSVIRKICKANLRSYLPEEIERIAIE